MLESDINPEELFERSLAGPMQFSWTAVRYYNQVLALTKKLGLCLAHLFIIVLKISFQEQKQR